MFVTLISFFTTLPVAAESPPLWLKQGTYARYNNSNGPRARSGWRLKNDFFSYDYYQWECLSLEGNIAVLNASIVLNKVVLYSACVHVNIENRSVTFPNGTYIGKTWLWLLANPSPDDTIEVTDSWSGKPQIGGWASTPQGAQKCYYIGDPFVGGGGFYDLDSGLCTQLHTVNEPTLLAMGVWDIGGPVIAATNVDLGPREWWVEIVILLPIIIPIIGFVCILLFVWHRRQQKKKQRKALMEKQRKTQKQPLQTPQKTNASLQDKKVG